jgi:hypothetical protein
MSAVYVYNWSIVREWRLWAQVDLKLEFLSTVIGFSKKKTGGHLQRGSVLI